MIGIGRGASASGTIEEAIQLTEDISSCVFAPKVILVTCAKAKGDEIAMAQSFRAVAPDLTCRAVVGAESMAAGYNGAARDADENENDIFVFTHTDVRLWASQELWDRALFACLRSDTGFVGVAGSAYLGGACVWWNHERVSPSPLCGAVAHQVAGEQYMTAFGPYGRAVVMDGVLLAIRREQLQKLAHWPEDLGWHFYDIEMTLRAHLCGMVNRVLPLPILHMSVGPVGTAWQESRAKFYARYKDRLPVSCV